MEKEEGAFLTISELAGELGLPQHILRYWETRFPRLRPLQRSGNRRYYRPADVALARRIHQLLNVEGFTVKGAQKALEDGEATPTPAAAPACIADTDLLVRLREIRTTLASAIGD
ncbi:MerR family transcriptional regulator [Sphingobium sp. YR768]|uniref:MerR family transcriptional regulator n=1 Tax=Sphingobium sp. YR768 TaxID=1884365 RepID=UPI0008C97F95|nr:MerR family transcriptional regulator [Sphingobium sp. YR768]SER05425.1 DNA-binding transcriptional regulator, MerR family [Sphingobium sp. YR768]